MRLGIPNLFAHGYLAVDFFFVLSGFVIAKAYAARLATGTLPVGKFYLVRLVRLLPLVVLGTLLATMIEWRRPDIVDQARHLKETFLALVCGSALIPILWSTTLEQSPFPLNAPVWSLFFEAVANAVFAPVARLRAGRIVLPALIAISAIFFFWGGQVMGKTNVGAGLDNFWFGFARVVWSFSVGIVLFVWRDRVPHVPFIISMVGLILILAAPDFGSRDLLFEYACVFVLLPALVFTASTARLGPSWRKFAAFSGDLSYPIYAIHYPFVRAMSFAGTKLHLLLAGRLIVATVGTLAIVVASAIVYVVYDMPIRRRLSAMLRSPALQQGRTGTR